MVKCFACQLGPILWEAPAAYIIFLAPSFYFAVRKRDLKFLYKKTLEQHSLEDEKIKPSICFAMRVLCWISPAREISSPRSVHSDLNRSSGVVFLPTLPPETVRFRPSKEGIPFPGVAPAIPVGSLTSGSGERTCLSLWDFRGNVDLAVISCFRSLIWNLDLWFYRKSVWSVKSSLFRLILQILVMKEEILLRKWRRFSDEVRF